MKILKLMIGLIALPFFVIFALGDAIGEAMFGSGWFINGIKFIHDVGDEIVQYFKKKVGKS